jgi:predicted RNase H-like HicB family nuclease
VRVVQSFGSISKVDTVLAEIAGGRMDLGGRYGLLRWNSRWFWQGLGVRFPDIPGCVGAGASPDEAIADATKALRDVMAYKRSERFELPKASAVSEILASGEIGPGETAILVPLVVDAGRTIRANLTFDAGLLAAIDDEATVEA